MVRPRLGLPGITFFYVISNIHIQQHPYPAPRCECMHNRPGTSYWVFVHTNFYSKNAPFSQAVPPYEQLDSDQVQPINSPQNTSLQPQAKNSIKIFVSKSHGALTLLHVQSLSCANFILTSFGTLGEYCPAPTVVRYSLGVSC